LNLLGEHTIHVDCDVIEADGGTRTASITGACVALVDAIRYLQRSKAITTDPLITMVASVSVGIYRDAVVVDLDYAEDSNAETDMNIVMNAKGGFIEVQVSAEGETFSEAQLAEMMKFAKNGIAELLTYQTLALAQ
jgi:ribonuclease PH